jgi:hypothetical protein
MSIRRFLLWLLMFAVPLQGMAASTMLLCGPSHHRQQAAAQVDVEVEAEAAHDHGLHHGASAIDLQDHDHADAGDAHTASGAHTPGSAGISKSKCSVCASCCSGVAIVATPLTTAVAEQPEPYTVFLATDFEPVFIDGPKKPPRFLLA